MKAKEVMSTALVVVPPEISVMALAELLAVRAISAVPVVDADGAPIGIVTEGDLIRRLADRPPGPLGWFLQAFGETKRQIQAFSKSHGACARDVMSTELVSVMEETSVEDIARLMERHGIRRVPVLRDGRLVGIVSRADLLRAILRAVPEPDNHLADGALLRAVVAALREQPWADTYWVFPEARDGIVTLYGYARSETMRQGLLVLARAVPGVTEVRDQMQPLPLIFRAAL